MIAAMIRMLAMMLVMVTLARLAAAQDARQLEVSGGYSFVHDPNNHISLAAGWMAGAGVALTDWLAAVVDAGASSKTISSFGSEVHVSVHTVMGGVRASAGVGKATEFGQVLVGREAARPAARRHDDDAVAGGARGLDHVTQGVLDVGARQADLEREARNRSRLTRQHIHQLFSEGHPPRLTEEDAENAENN